MKNLVIGTASVSLTLILKKRKTRDTIVFSLVQTNTGRELFRAEIRNKDLQKWIDEKE